MTEPAPEKEVIKAIQEGNEAAFRQVFEANYESLCQYAFTIVKNSIEAEDIVQSVFLKFWERKDDIDVRVSVRSYLFRAVYNQCLNHLEHKAVMRKHTEYEYAHALGLSQSPDVFPSELEDKVKQAVEKLPPQCKTIFIMSRYEELRYSEIADKLNISPNTIQNQICKALKILREELKDLIV